MKKFKASLISVALMSAVVSGDAVASQQLVDQISQFGVKYKVTDNLAAQHGVDCGELGADWASCNRATISFTNHGPAIDSKDWAIYMSNVHETLKVESDQFRMVHIVGDLTRLEPTDKFKGIAAGETIEIPIVNEYWQLFITDVMPRWYATSGDATPKILVSTDTEVLTDFVEPFGSQWKRIEDDKNQLMNAQGRFTKNSDVAPMAASTLRGQILPTPLKVSVFSDDADFSAGVTLDLASLPAATAGAIQQRFALMGINAQPNGYPITTRVSPNALDKKRSVPGGYTLNIAKDKAEVVGYDQSGVFYGLQSILSLVPADGSLKVATLKASDAPRFQYRAVFLDVARNFHSKEVVLRLLDHMAAWKLNVFHFHLTDDEGWRIEIPGLPELTEVGSKRCHDLEEQRCLLPQLGSGPHSDNSGSGHFSRQQYIDIVKYADARGIQVIPEIDMPAHARAAVISMEARHDRLYKAGKEKEANEFRLIDPSDNSNTTSVQLYDRTSYLNPCLSSSLRFTDKVIGEIQAMHKAAGQPLKTWHFGGDEAKNIRLGTGYSDKKTPVEGTGLLDLSQQDKPWAKSQVCQTMIEEGKIEDLDHLPSDFALNVSKQVRAHGIGKMQAWQDGIKDAKNAKAFATDRVAVNFWDTLFWGGFDSANDWASKGYEVIVSSPDYLYLDFPAEVNPLERGYYWGTRFTDERKIFNFTPDNLPQNAETSVDRDGKSFTAKSDKPWPGAYGISAQLWSETTRTDSQVEYKLFPRILSVAERAWHRAAWEQDYQAGKEYIGGKTRFVDRQAQLKDWQRFANLLGQRELAKLDKAGIAYRLPVPGGEVQDGKLVVNIELPGLTVEYSLDQGTSWQQWQASQPPAVAGKVLLRTRSPDGLRVSRTESL